MLGFGRDRAMLSEYRHRRVARVAIEDGECHGMDETGVMLGVFAQFAEFALGHGSRLSGLRFAQQEEPRTIEFAGGTALLVACNVEIESNICYQSVCLEQRSDCRGPNLRNCRDERARGCCAPVTCAVRG